MPDITIICETIHLDKMNYRILGKTGLTISEVGYGAWGIGKSAWIGASDAESVKALHRSIDLGLNFIDTALAYGEGHSERVRKIASDLNISLDQMAETALRYVLGHPAVSTVIPGMRSVRNVERNCQVGDGHGLPGEQVEKLKAHRWVRNFYE